VHQSLLLYFSIIDAAANITANSNIEEPIAILYSPVLFLSKAVTVKSPKETGIRYSKIEFHLK
jgi:hypothetical protein